LENEKLKEQNKMKAKQVIVVNSQKMMEKLILKMKQQKKFTESFKLFICGLEFIFIKIESYSN
jgi:hypothetical protein